MFPINNVIMKSDCRFCRCLVFWFRLLQSISAKDQYKQGISEVFHSGIVIALVRAVAPVGVLVLNVQFLKGGGGEGNKKGWGRYHQPFKSPRSHFTQREGSGLQGQMRYISSGCPSVSRSVIRSSTQQFIGFRRQIFIAHLCPHNLQTTAPQIHTLQTATYQAGLVEGKMVVTSKR